MPRGYQDMSAEYVSVRRHVLQVSATGEKDLVAKMKAHANGDHVDGFQVSDDTHAVIFHEPYDRHGRTDVGPQEDGPTLYAGNIFGDSPMWKYDLARQLIEQADEELGEPVELLQYGTVRDETCPRCGNPETGYSLVPKDDEGGERNVYQRCAVQCGWQRNLGWFRAEYTPVVQAIIDLNKEKA